MRLSDLATPLLGIVPAVANFGEHIADIQQGAMWCVAGGLCGASTMIAFPSKDATFSLKRKFIASILAAPGLSAAVFGFSSLEPTILKVFAVAYVIALTAYWSIPMFERGGKAIGSKWIKKQAGDDNG